MKEKIRKCRKEVKEIVVLPVCQGIACFFGHLGFLLKFSGKEKKIYIIYIRKTKHSEAKKIKKKKKA